MPAENPFEYLESGYEGVGEFYDLFADNTDIPFILEFARKTGSPILDLAAGTGRVTFALAQEGFDVVALEQSQSMLAEAKEKLKRMCAVESR
jgi:ubiquinone/menaquinone biosynthesis C-methylase UbiE